MGMEESKIRVKISDNNRKNHKYTNAPRLPPLMMYECMPAHTCKHYNFWMQVKVNHCNVKYRKNVLL